MPLSIDIYGYAMLAVLGVVILVNLVKKVFSHHN